MIDVDFTIGKSSVKIIQLVLEGVILDPADANGTDFKIANFQIIIYFVIIH